MINEKYVPGVPLYRQEQELSRLGVGLSRQTLANWTLEATERYLARIMTTAGAFSQGHHQADETTVQVLQEAGARLDTIVHVALPHRTGRPPIVLFDYQQTRSGQHPVEFLSGFSGYRRWTA